MSFSQSSNCPKVHSAGWVCLVCESVTGFYLDRSVTNYFHLDSYVFKLLRLKTIAIIFKQTHLTGFDWKPGILPLSFCIFGSSQYFEITTIHLIKVDFIKNLQRELFLRCSSLHLVQYYRWHTKYKRSQSIDSGFQLVLGRSGIEPTFFGHFLSYSFLYITLF